MPISSAYRKSTLISKSIRDESKNFQTDNPYARFIMRTNRAGLSRTPENDNMINSDKSDSPCISKPIDSLFISIPIDTLENNDNPLSEQSDDLSDRLSDSLSDSSDNEPQVDIYCMELFSERGLASLHGLTKGMNKILDFIIYEHYLTLVSLLIAVIVILYRTIMNVGYGDPSYQCIAGSNIVAQCCIDVFTIASMKIIIMTVHTLFKMIRNHIINVIAYVLPIIVTGLIIGTPVTMITLMAGAIPILVLLLMEEMSVSATYHNYVYGLMGHGLLMSATIAIYLIHGSAFDHFRCLP